MTTQDENYSAIISHLKSVHTLKYAWHTYYEIIMRCCVEGRPFKAERGSQIDIAFLAALMAMPKAEEVFHPRGIVVEKIHFGPSSVSVRSEETQISRFDLADSRFPLPLVLRNCTFAETLDLRRAHLASLDLTGSTLPALMLQGAHIDGPLLLEKTHFTFGAPANDLRDTRKSFLDADDKHDPDKPHAGIDANDLVTADRIFLKESLVRGGIRLRHAQIGGDFVAKQTSHHQSPLRCSVPPTV